MMQISLFLPPSCSHTWNRHAASVFECMCICSYLGMCWSILSNLFYEVFNAFLTSLKLLNLSILSGTVKRSLNQNLSKKHLISVSSLKTDTFSSEDYSTVPAKNQKTVHDQYSRSDFVGEPLPQDESDGSEDHHSGTHGPTPRISRLGTAGGLEHWGFSSHWKARMVKAETVV